MTGCWKVVGDHRGNDRQREHDRRRREENQRHEREMRRHAHESDRDWHNRQDRESKVITIR